MGSFLYFVKQNKFIKHNSLKLLRVWKKTYLHVTVGRECAHLYMIHKHYFLQHFMYGSWHSGLNCLWHKQPITETWFKSELPHFDSVLLSHLGRDKKGPKTLAPLSSVWKIRIEFVTPGCWLLTSSFNLALIWLLWPFAGWTKA